MNAIILARCLNPVWINCEVQSTEILINPQIMDVKEPFSYDYEYNPSFPFMRAKIGRYQEVKVKYLKENEEVERSFKDFESRVL